MPGEQGRQPWWQRCSDATGRPRGLKVVSEPVPSSSRLPVSLQCLLLAEPNWKPTGKGVWEIWRVNSGPQCLVEH